MVKDLAGDAEPPVPHQRRLARPRLAEQDVADVFAVERVLLGNLRAGQLAERRQKIAAGDDRRIVDPPAGTWPGQRTMNGTRTPPSYRLRLRPRNGPAEPTPLWPALRM